MNNNEIHLFSHGVTLTTIIVPNISLILHKYNHCHLSIIHILS